MSGRSQLLAGAVAALRLLLRTTLLLLLCSFFWGVNPIWNSSWSPVAEALPPGNAITDGKALLRYSLPIDNKPIRTIQADIEGIADFLRARRMAGVTGNLNKAEKLLNRKEAEILASVPPERQPQATELIAQIRSGIEAIQAEAAVANKDAIWMQRSSLLDQVGELEELMVAGFPFEVPVEYANLPQLKGRASVEVETTKGTMTLVVDGYNAPVTAGNFIDLVQRGFYDGLEFTRAEDNYVLQIGDPPGKEVGFIDPKTQKYRAIPMEVMIQGDKKPMYGVTMEEAGRYLDQPVLPFSAFGTLGMARPSEDVNGGSSQFFFFLFEAELTPAGLNLLDGRYAVFGYVTQNKDVLEKLKQGDKIISAKVVNGLENLVEPA
ncbi:MAG: peptidylprolyl isomerase [Pegethrix bostrychoides GSE-TBD4-15B]|jgi:peptidylprolyl isomerase|uniref:peptidylprolyl isomerase n=1 Tax=Pegethrix bostrychoides GSE-TBD4-15B TaxID=2839662 RepID=A0A951PCH8_9CYAN|nr:peptidylprolyl isomerase [Pegethrix bostrychoides GSE-TBD4-15B]